MSNESAVTRSRPPAVDLMRKLGLEPDPWQVEVLEADHPHLLLNCCRQAGKSTAVAMLGLAEAVFVPFTKVLLVSRSLRQSTELFRIVTDFYHRLGKPLQKRQTAEELQLDNFSRIVCLPCKEETIRGYSHVTLLVIDEAARVPDDLYRAVRPMLAVSNGRLICLSTPYGKRGFFYDAWANGKADWARIEVPADRIKRISRDFLAAGAPRPGRILVPPGIPVLVRGPGGPGVSRLRPLCDARPRPGQGPPGRRHRLRFPQPVCRRLGRA